MLDIMLILFGIVIAILFLVTVFLVVNATRKLKNYDRCMGVIERFWERKAPASEPGRTLISPIVSYTVNGKNYEFVGDYGSVQMKIGQEIELLCDREDPSKVTIKKGLYVAPLITGVIALGFSVAFVIIAVVKNSGL